MLAINREELAWAAGFFDGEGHAQITLKGRARGFRLNIPQVDPRPIQRFHQAVLGLGSIHRVAARERWQAKSVWSTGSFEQGQAVVALLWSFLSEPKREQIRAGLLECQSASHNGAPFCRRGHSDWVQSPRSGHGNRYCRTCEQESHRRSYLRRKESPAYAN